MINCGGVRELGQFSRVGCDFFDLGFQELIRSQSEKNEKG